MPGLLLARSHDTTPSPPPPADGAARHGPDGFQTPRSAGPVNGFLADIGMEILPHHVLNRRGALSSADYDAVKKHPEASERLLRTMGYTSDGVLSIIRASHEEALFKLLG
jgi:hypothetical protein